MSTPSPELRNAMTLMAHEYLAKRIRQGRRVAAGGGLLVVASFVMAMGAVWSSDTRWWWTAGLSALLGILLGVGGLGVATMGMSEVEKLGQPDKTTPTRGR